MIYIYTIIYVCVYICILHILWLENRNWWPAQDPDFWWNKPPLKLHQQTAEWKRPGLFCVWKVPWFSSGHVGNISFEWALAWFIVATDHTSLVVQLGLVIPSGAVPSSPTLTPNRLFERWISSNGQTSHKSRKNHQPLGVPGKSSQLKTGNKDPRFWWWLWWWWWWWRWQWIPLITHHSTSPSGHGLFAQWRWPCNGQVHDPLLSSKMDLINSRWCNVGI